MQDELRFELLMSRDGNSVPMRVLQTAALSQMQGGPARFVAPLELWSIRKLELANVFGFSEIALSEVEANLNKTGFGKLAITCSALKLEQAGFQSFAKEEM